MADEFDFSDVGAPEAGDEFDFSNVGRDEFDFSTVGPAPDEFDFSDVDVDPTFIGEAGRALASGLQRGGENTLGLLMKPLELTIRALTDSEAGPDSSELVRQSIRRDFGERERPQTLPGQIGEAAVQFLAPLGLVAKTGKAVGIAQASTRLGRAAQIEGAAIVAEQAAFDPHEERLSNLIESQPALANPVTDFLKADENDTEAEARFKMALESLGLGAVVGSMVEGLRGIRRARAARPPPAPAPTIDPAVAKQQEELIDLSTNIEGAKRKGHVPESPSTPVREQLPPNLNTARLNTTDEVSAELLRISEAKDNFAPQRRGVVSHEETRQLAKQMGLTEDELLKLPRASTLNAHEALSARQMLVDSGEKLVEQAKRASGGDLQALAQFKQHMARHVAIQEQVSGITAEAGRTLNQFNILAKSPEGVREAGLKVLVDTDGRLEDLAAKIADMENPGQISRLTRESMQPRFIDKVLEVWINSLLSGPQTHAVNMLSNTLTALWTVPEQLVAGGLGALRGAADRITVRETAARAHGFVQGGRDGVRLAWEAFKDPDSVPIGLGTKLEQPRQQALGTGVVAKAINLPGRFLQAEDRLFQAIGYRMELNQRAMASGLAQGLKGRALGRHMREVLNNTPDDVAAAAQGAARYQTFTTPSEGFVADLTRLANRRPMLRFVVPFIRTPTNILRFAAERSPLGLFTSRYKAAIEKGGRDADLARARMVMGSSIMAWVGSEALEGNITGKGPTDPELRAAWRKLNQPYSIKVDDEWVSFQRIEPLGVLLGVAADSAEIFREAESGAEVDEIAVSLAAALANNLTSKTWLKGLSDLVKVLSDPQRYGDSYIQAYAGSVVPAAVAQATRTGIPGILDADPILRDTNSMVDRILSRIPGYSTELPARLNIFGEPIVSEGGLGPDFLSPLWTQEITSQPLAEEMFRVKAEVGKPDRKIRGVELSPKEYHDFAKLAGQMGKFVANEFLKLPGWKDLPDFQKREAIQEAFRDARDAARKVTIVKFNLAPRIAAKQLEKTK